MSEQTPPPEGPPEGQIHTPNPLELFWEKNRTGIILSVIVLFLVIVGRWAWEEKVRADRNATWGEFAQKTGLTLVYAPEDAKLPSMNLPPEQMRQFMGFLLGEVQRKQWVKVKGDLNTNLEGLSEADIEGLMKTYAGEPAGWWAEWVLACKYRALGETGKVEATLASLKKKAPDFAAFYKTTYPPVYVPKPEEEKEKDDKKKRRRVEQILQAADDSLAAALTESSKREAAFRKAYPELYVPAEPKGKTVTFETSEGVIQVRLYEEASPKTCAQFLENIEKGLYKDLYFSEIWKKTEGAFQANDVELVFFGNPNSKDEDLSKWTDFKSEKTIPFEVNKLSHFPYMLCAVREDDRRDSDTQLVYITGNDCAKSRDGDYVVFGRIINDEGRSLVDKMIASPLFSTQEEESGKGKPSEPILVREVRVEK